MCLKLLHDSLGGILGQYRRPRGARLRGHLLAAQVVVRLNRLVVRLDQHAGLRCVVRAGKRDLLGASRSDGVGGEDHVHLIIDKHLLARGRGHLRELVLGGVAQNVASDELGQTQVKAADLAVFLIEQREKIRGLRAAEAQRASLFDLAGPGARCDGRRIGHRPLRNQSVIGRCIDGSALCEKRPTGHDRQCHHGGFQNGFDRHAVFLDGLRRESI